MTHALKINPTDFAAVVAGIMNYQLRKDDRPFNNGDTVIFQEYDNDKYTGKEHVATISYVKRDAKQFGLRDGFAAFGIKEKDSIN